MCRLQSSKMLFFDFKSFSSSTEIYQRWICHAVRCVNVTKTNFHRFAVPMVSHISQRVRLAAVVLTSKMEKLNSPIVNAFRKVSAIERLCSNGLFTLLHCKFPAPDFLEKSHAISGFCDGNCQSFLLFISLFSFFVFVHSTSEVGSMLLIMRCTDPKGKRLLDAHEKKNCIFNGFSIVSFQIKRWPWVSFNLQSVYLEMFRVQSFTVLWSIQHVLYGKQYAEIKARAHYTIQMHSDNSSSV